MTPDLSLFDAGYYLGFFMGLLFSALAVLLIYRDLKKTANKEKDMTNRTRRLPQDPQEKIL